MRLHRWCVCLVLLAVPLSACDGDEDSQSCELTVSKRLEVEPADPPLEFHLDRCRIDVDACPELCQLALSRIDLEYRVKSCDVGFVGEVALLDVEYTVPNPNSNCFFDDVVFQGGAR